MMRMAEFLQTEKDTSADDFTSRFQHGFLLVSKTPSEEHDGGPRPFHTRDAEQAREQIIRSQGDADLYSVVSSKPNGAPTVTIGRTPSNDIVLDSPSVSKFHAYFRVGANGSCTLHDPGSKNGTKVNGVRLEKGQPVTVSGGETIVFGNAFEATFHTALTLHRHMSMLQRWSAR